jgi:predicted transcriptional regulator
MKPENGFTKLPNAVYGVLSDQEIVLYGYLLHRKGRNESAWWSIKALADSLGWSESKVKRVTKSLTAKGWLQTWLTVNPKSGNSLKHYRVLNPLTGQNRTQRGVTDDLLKRTSKNNQQTKQASASELASRFIDDEVLILEKPSGTDLSLSDLSILEKPNLEKPKEKSALERLSREKPFPELSELLRSLPSEISSQIAVTSTLNDLLARLMITQGRSLAELKLWLADPQLWKGSKNPGGFLTSLLKRQLENGYTPKETSGQPLVAWSMENPPPYCGVCDPETRKNDFWSELPDGNGAKTLSCLICNPFMVNKYGGRLKTHV